MHCAGHAVRSHIKAFDTFRTMKKFTPTFCTQHETFQTQQKLGAIVARDIHHTAVI